jgi:hypothetical protein
MDAQSTTGKSCFNEHQNKEISAEQYCFLGLTILLTYLLTAWRRVLLEKLAGSQLVKKFPVFYGTRKFITAFTHAQHLSLS